MKKKEKSIANKIFIIFFCVLLSAYTLTMIFTLAWGFLTTLKNPMELEGSIQNWLGFPILDANEKTNSIEYFFKLKNYTDLYRAYSNPDVKSRIFRDITFIQAGKEITHRAQTGIQWVLINTAVYTIIGSVLHTFVPAITAYAVAKYKNPVGSIITGAALFAMTTPIVGSQASMLTMLREMGLYDTLWGYLLQKASFTGMYYFVFSAFYQSLPDSFSEAAEIDGASQFKILTTIILPLSIKMLSTVFLIQFIHFWNDYQTANLYMPTHPTLAFVVWKLTVDNTINEITVRIAATMSLALPILLAFIFLKNKLMGNVTMGGLKQ